MNACATCGTPLPIDQGFCSRCGATATAVSAPSPQAMNSVQRIVAMFYAPRAVFRDIALARSWRVALASAPTHVGRDTIARLGSHFTGGGVGSLCDKRLTISSVRRRTSTIAWS